MAKAGKSASANMTPEQRSAETSDAPRSGRKTGTREGDDTAIYSDGAGEGEELIAIALNTAAATLCFLGGYSLVRAGGCHLAKAR
jgi:hypothetical protein